jgi:hypothetical protein
MWTTWLVELNFFKDFHKFMCNPQLINEYKNYGEFEVFDLKLFDQGLPFHLKNLPIPEHSFGVGG